MIYGLDERGRALDRLGAMPLGALLGGGLATWMGLRATLWIGVAGGSLAGLFVLFSPLRSLRDIG